MIASRPIASFCHQQCHGILGIQSLIDAPHDDSSSCHTDSSLRSFLVIKSPSHMRSIPPTIWIVLESGYTTRLLRLSRSLKLNWTSYHYQASRDLPTRYPTTMEGKNEAMLAGRNYQIEMLQESMARNIIVAVSISRYLEV